MLGHIRYQCFRLTKMIPNTRIYLKHWKSNCVHINLWHTVINSFICFAVVRFYRFYHILQNYHDDVIKWKHFPRYWPFVRGIHRSPVNSPHKGQWRGALMFSLICGRINGWVNNGEAGDLRRHHAHYDVSVMFTYDWSRAWGNGPDRCG